MSETWELLQGSLREKVSQVQDAILIRAHASGPHFLWVWELAESQVKFVLTCAVLLFAGGGRWPSAYQNSWIDVMVCVMPTSVTLPPGNAHHFFCRGEWGRCRCTRNHVCTRFPPPQVWSREQTQLQRQLWVQQWGRREVKSLEKSEGLTEFSFSKTAEIGSWCVERLWNGWCFEWKQA